MFDGIIFDVDGTLWDSRRQVVCGWSEAKRELVGYPLDASFEEVTSWFGRSMTDIAELMFREFDSKTAIEYGNKCFLSEIKYLQKHPGEIFDGVREMLETLAEKYPLYIVSNCQSGYIEILLESGGLTDLFNGYLCFEDTMLPKDRTIRILMEKYGIKNTVYIGDTQGDCDACKAADVPFVFVEYGFGTVSDECPHAKSVEDIPRVILELDK